ncbi:hypothetical protein [Nocardiopsis changdeensis]|uniref:hypothetical protein n=1 Tax=Nocardiopsis changdeensis TaxID=2831969 RepID=UPI003F49A570
MTYPHPRQPTAAPRYRSRVTVAPLVRALGFLIPLPLMAIASLGYINFEFWQATFYVLLALGIGLLLSALVSRVASVRVEVRDGVLTLSKVPLAEVLLLGMGEIPESERLRLPVAEISYAGSARFRLRDITLRTDGNFTKRRAGGGMEFVTRDGRYLVARVKDADGLKHALLAHGMHPAALQVPFPPGIGSPETVREQRAYHPGPPVPPPYGR